MTSFRLVVSVFVIVSIASIISAKPTNQATNSDDEVNVEDNDEKDLSGLESEEEETSDFTIIGRTGSILDGEDEIKNPEYGSHHQGDMILEPEQLEALYRNESEQIKVEQRTGLLSDYYRWPKNQQGKVIVPVVIQFAEERIKNMILEAMRQIMEATCIQFVYRSSENDYILLRRGGAGCSSNIGRIRGPQSLSLDDGCHYIGTIIHELIHALGYTHMQNHIDRDKYVKIHWNNIQPDMVYNFKKVNTREFGNFGTKYDYYSLMHYDSTAFGNGRRTMTPLKYPEKYINIMGQRSKMSKGDKKRLNTMYQCSR